MSNTLYYKNDSVRHQIDGILFEMAQLFANTGMDSTLAEHKQALKKEQDLMDEIDKIDPEFGKVIRPYGRQEY